MPEVHVEASVILAGVNLGEYAILIPIFDYTVLVYLYIIYIVCVVGMFYVCIITLRQADLKRIIAYSSTGYMSLVVMALYTNNAHFFDGSIYVVLSHGIISGALFLYWVHL